MVTPTPKIWRFRKVHVSSDIFRLVRRITNGVGVEGRVATYRCAHHHPVIPMARVENLESHVEPQGKTGSGNRECYELDNDEGRTPGLGVDVIRGGHEATTSGGGSLIFLGGEASVALSSLWVVTTSTKDYCPRRRTDTLDMCVRGGGCCLAGYCLLQDLNGWCWSRGSVADMIRTVGTSSRKRNPG